MHPHFKNAQMSSCIQKGTVVNDLRLVVDLADPAGTGWKKLERY